MDTKELEKQESVEGAMFRLHLLNLISNSCNWEYGGEATVEEESFRRIYRFILDEQMKWEKEQGY